jgi:hypothetical protein
MINAAAGSSLKKFFLIQKRWLLDTANSDGDCLPQWMSQKSLRDIESVRELVASFNTFLVLACEAARRIAKSHSFIPQEGNFSSVQILEQNANLRCLLSDSPLDGYSKVEALINNAKSWVQSPEAFGGLADLHLNTQRPKDVGKMLHMLACEGYDRVGQAFTPDDIARLMCRLAKSENDYLDIYADYGLGIYLGGVIEYPGMLKLVGDESFAKKQQTEMILPPRLADALSRAAVALDRSAIMDRLLCDLETFPLMRQEKGRALVINAALNEVPFHPRHDEVSETLDPLLQSGYSRIVVLVQNGYLTGGKYFSSDQILSHCISRGLRSVIQLPNGTIGAMHEAYSILVFEPNAKFDVIEFREIESIQSVKAGPATRVAERGFGHPWRKVGIDLDYFTPTGRSKNERTHQESVQTLKDRLLLASKSRVSRKELASFEVNRFLVDDALDTSIRNSYQWVKLGDIAEIHRIQHLPAAPDGVGIKYHEITADALGEYGDLSRYEEKYTHDGYESRLSRAALKVGDIFVCIRGPIGRVGFVEDELTSTLLPNQSFVKITLKSNRKVNVSSEMIYWWMRSEICRNILASRAIMTGVKRLSMFDLERLEIPVLSNQQYAIERSKYQAWKAKVSLVLASRRDIEALQKKAYAESDFLG